MLDVLACSFFFHKFSSFPCASQNYSKIFRKHSHNNNVIGWNGWHNVLCHSQLLIVFLNVVVISLFPSFCGVFFFLRFPFCFRFSLDGMPFCHCFYSVTTIDGKQQRLFRALTGKSNNWMESGWIPCRALFTTIYNTNYYM